MIITFIDSCRGKILLIISIIAKLILPKELFANINLALDELKLKTISSRFGTLRLCIVHYFCRILKEIICKGSLVFDLLFKLKIRLALIEKVSGARRTLADFKSLIRGKTVAKALVGVVDQGVLVVENVSEVRKTSEKASGS